MAEDEKKGSDEPTGPAYEKGKPSGAIKRGATQRREEPQVDPEVQRALDEYEQIRQELPTVAATSKFLALGGECARPARWCLPDVNCSARGFGKEAQSAFDDNRRFCGSGSIKDY